MMTDFEEEILAEISQWAFSKYGIAAMTMEPQNLAKEFWKEKFE